MISISRQLLHTVLSLLMVTTACSAFAWGKDAHHVISKLAESQLTETARSEIDRLLSLEPGSSLVSISTWADEHRNPATAPWHYINFPRDTCTYEAERDCSNGQCIVVALERQLKVLGSTGSDEKRLNALKYVVHLMGDVHQPLHAGYLDDRGGNSYQLQVIMRGSNLHALWDVAMIQKLSEDTDQLSKRLKANPKLAASTNLEVINAAEESCKIVGMTGFYPERKVDVEYFDRFTPILEQRLALAGARLAGVLNQVLLRRE